jgi:ribosome biogenesis GTPase
MRDWATDADWINLGWDDARAAQYRAACEELGGGESLALLPGRIVVRHPGQYAVLTPQGEMPARIKGVLRRDAETWAEMPTVGDWVVIGPRPDEPLWHIHKVLERRTRLIRKSKGTRTVPQVIAANVTVIVVVMGMTGDYNIRRLERYLVIIRESGARPVVVLNKADLLEDDELRQALDFEVRESAPQAEVHVVSALESEGIEEVRSLLAPGETVIFVGSSGAGKSTLINAILREERQATGDVRKGDGKGRHTTTTRELFVIPGHGAIIDSPGIREIQLWTTSAEGLEEAFADIEELVKSCRFSNCTHRNEPGCAILKAIADEDLDPERLRSYESLHREVANVRQREAELAEVRRRVFRSNKPGRKKGGR